MAPSVPATNTHQDGDTDAHAKVDIGDISPKQYPEAMRVRRFDPLPARRAGVLLASALLALVVVVPLAFATQPAAADTSSASSFSRISVVDPLNGGFLVVNMHGMLFHPDTSDVAADLAYARWLGGGIIRVFATDSNGLHRWNGTQVGARIAEIAPMLRAAHLRLIVAFVNNHQAVPGEATASAGWMDNYMQLLLPFYTDTWHGAYQQFVRDLVTTVEWYQTQDVIYAWELGNELHTPAQPNALISFVTEASTQVRALDPVTPILPGTMGANHVEPGNRQSSIARWLYCDAPVDAYTLHAYDWVSRQRPGDMPIDWDLDNIVSKPCPNGRTLPVIVEELGTSRALAGVYTADDERARLEQERRQIAFVRQFPSVVGFGVWNGESPELNDRTFVDIRRGLTSYGTTGPGGGSCFDPHPDAAPGARCQLEQMLRGVHFLRVAESSDWVVDADASTTGYGAQDQRLGARSFGERFPRDRQPGPVCRARQRHWHTRRGSCTGSVAYRLADGLRQSGLVARRLLDHAAARFGAPWTNSTHARGPHARPRRLVEQADSCHPQSGADSARCPDRDACFVAAANTSPASPGRG